jgi:TRAP-type uncharacterized transport system fused permease subunit
MSVTFTAIAGVWALSGAVGGYLIRQCGSIERAMLVLSGILLFYAGTIQDIIGFFMLAVVVLLQIIKVRTDKKVAATKVV